MEKKSNKNEEEVVKPIMMGYDYWINTYFSVARFYGGMKYNGHSYFVVGKEQDLLLSEFIPLYNEMGREAFILMIDDVKDLSLAKAKEIYKQYIKQ